MENILHERNNVDGDLSTNQGYIYTLNYHITSSINDNDNKRNAASSTTGKDTSNKHTDFDTTIDICNNKSK